MDKKPVLNKVKNRLLILSPTVKDCLERECNKNDFIQEGGRPIGKGGFGEVWKVTCKQTKKVFVIKVMNKKSIIEQKLVDQINREIEIMYKVDHPHIVKLINHFEDEESFYLIMNYASKGQLYTLLKKYSRFDEKTAAQYIRELISAIKYLHSFDPPIIHRDIKPENILLDENYRIKLADFGWSNYYNSDEIRKTYCGTPEYLSPEMLKKQGHDTSIDIWSIGILLFELLSGHSPFGGSSQEELFYNIKKHKVLWPSDFPIEAKSLVALILKQNPKDRVTLDQINDHVWFTTIPGIKPALVNKEMDSKTMLESHLVLSLRPGEEVVSLTKKVKSQKFESNEKNLNDNNSDIKNEEIDILKKEIIQYKQKLEKINLDISKYTAEISKYKETEIYWETINNENLQLKEEIEQQKVLNQNRLDLLYQLETQNIELIKNKKIIENNENELINNKKTLKFYENKLIESRHLTDELEKSNNELKQEIEDLKQKYESSNFISKKVIENLQEKILIKSENPEAESIDYLTELITEQLKELKMFLQSKTKNLAINLRSIQENTDKTDELFTKIINDKHLVLVSLMDKTKTIFEEDCEKMFKREVTIKPCKTNQRIEDLKKQIVELMPLKLKNIELEAKIEKCENSLKILNLKLAALNENKNACDTLLNEKEHLIKNLKDNIVNLEAKLSDVKDFVFKNCSGEKLEEFTVFY